MHRIKKFLVVCFTVITAPSYGMLVFGPKYSTETQKLQPKRHPSLAQLKEKYSSYEGIVWDPEEIYSAQEAGYMPIEVDVFDAYERVEKQVIYHGSHVKAVELPLEKKNYRIRILSQELSENLAELLYRRNIQHPVIFASYDYISEASQTVSHGNYSIYINPSDINLATIGHELGHCKINNEIKWNPLLTEYEKQKKAQTFLLGDEAMLSYFSAMKNGPHLVEFYCDKMAAHILADTKEAKRFIIKQGIRAHQKTLKKYGDESSDRHPLHSLRIQYLQFQLNELEKTSE